MDANLRVLFEVKFAATAPIRVLRALKSLLTYWAPALLRLGYCVRQCAWEGRPGQAVTGVTAQQILQSCLIMHTHLQDD